MKKFRIKDSQIAGRYFAQGEAFDDREHAEELLFNFHEIDCEDKEVLSKLSLEELCEYGGWEIEIVYKKYKELI